jgi:hypothetical protein
MENRETKPNEPINTIEYNNNYISTGLTKREYFAAMALQGFITKYGVDCQEEHIKQAIFLAGFFIEELNKTK